VKKFLKSDIIFIDHAENGKIVTKKFKPNSYDLVLMDLRMPEIDGYEATKWIRKLEKEQHASNIPIIAISASSTKEEVQKSLCSGCNEHLSKPLKKDPFFKTIFRYYDILKQNRN